MPPAGITTLFAEVPTSRREPSVFLLSILVHGLALSLLYLGLKNVVRIENAPLTRYTVRLMNLESPPLQQRARQSAGQGSARAASRSATTRAAASPGGAPAAPSLPVELAQTTPAPQTLVQPDLPRNLLNPKQMPIPMVLMWSPKNLAVRRIVPPPPVPIIVANVHPSIKTPNRELNLADLKVSATAFVTNMPAPLPSTTVPLVVHGPEKSAQVPSPATKSTAPPTPARVMSLSDIQLEHGVLALPLVNETAPAGSAVTLLPGIAKNSAGSSSGSPANDQNGSSKGEGSGNQTGKAAAAGPGGQNGENPGSGLAVGLGPAAGASSGPESGSGSANEPTLTRVDVPKDGHFGAVVVGSSLAEEYPETARLWSDRLVYTVYLHVGLPKSWILQYGLPRTAEVSAAGSVARPDAPWPYLMERFELAPGDSDADAIMVHGFVNAGGHFEHLAIVFPTEFAQAKFVLNALEQWQFRPAALNGKVAAVEVLLIIPDQSE
jgi:hypothetical protein